MIKKVGGCETGAALKNKGGHVGCFFFNNGLFWFADLVCFMNC